MQSTGARVPSKTPQVGGGCEQVKLAHSSGSKTQAAVFQGKSEQRGLGMVAENFFNEEDFTVWFFNFERYWLITNLFKIFPPGKSNHYHVSQEE